MIIDGDGCARQVGLVSWGSGCGNAGKYGVYTRLSSFASWFRENGESSLTFGAAPPVSLTTLQSEPLKQLGKVLSAAVPVEIILPNNGQMRDREKFHIKVRSSVAGRLILIDIGSKQGIHQVFPVERDNVSVRLNANEVLSIPSDDAHYFLATPPGSSELIAIVVPEQFPYDSMVGSAELLRRSKSSIVAIGKDEVADYLINLVDQVVRIQRTTNDSGQGSSWAYSRIPYSISN